MTKLKALVAAVLPRLTEKSTVVGVLSLLSLATGLVVAPAQADAIATVVATVAGLGLVVVREAP